MFKFGGKWQRTIFSKNFLEGEKWQRGKNDKGGKMTEGITVILSKSEFSFFIAKLS